MPEKSPSPRSSQKWLRNLTSRLDAHIQRLTIRRRLLILCLGLLLIFSTATLLLGWVIQQREAQEAEQTSQYDRLQAIMAVHGALAGVRHQQGLMNVAKLIGDKTLADEVMLKVVGLEGVLEDSLQRVSVFDPQTASTVREARSMAIQPMQKSIEAMAQRETRKFPLALEAMAHLSRVQETLDAAGQRERIRADQITQDQMARAPP